MDPRAGPNVLEKKKSFLPVPAVEPQIVNSVALLIHRLEYPGSFWHVLLFTKSSVTIFVCILCRILQVNTVFAAECRGHVS
jgi:hypothetical protein